MSRWKYEPRAQRKVLEEKNWDIMSLQTALKIIGIHIKLLNVTFPLVFDTLINNRSLKNFQEGIFKIPVSEISRTL